MNKRLGSQLDQNDADLPYNRRKNRYSNILPYDCNRVALSELKNSDEPTNYINASYIQVPNCIHRYIATQAPLPNTILDFWRMVFENKSPIILVLTKEFEGLTRKYHCYWPINQIEPFHFDNYDLMVEFLEEKKHPLSNELTIAYFKLSGFRPGDDKMATQYVTQIRFEGWPDFGVPNNPSILITVLDVYHMELAMQQEKAEENGMGPSVIHCSAGVGRTGTFCAIDSALFILKSWTPAKSDLVVHIINAFRQQRVYMVQSKAQFHFIYKVLNYYVQTRPDGYY
ncbi:receptor/non-receptor type protein-tyrosine phosphatase [Neoconidiobolus thromboides FSU 785]|nr:receptor/non-receptor type protein-tyrosine phosphatase [Neoconidiobolus thromboides FSU 785]